MANTSTSISCRLCGGCELRLYYRQGSEGQYRFYRCDDCALVNLDTATIDHLANQEKYALSYTDPIDPHINRGSFASYEFIRKHFDRRGTYLDVGCGNGALLNQARADGWQVRGLELSPILAGETAKQLGIDVQVADFMQYEPNGDRFDLVSLRHVLEHLPDANLALRNIGRLTKPGGHALLEFPNIDALVFKVQRMRERCGLGREYPVNYRPGHCNEFCHKSFAVLLERTGFDLVLWQTYSYSPLKNFLANLIPVGTKARALIRKRA